MNKFFDISQYELGNCLGEGPMADVYRLKNKKSQNSLIIKIFKKPIDKDDLRLEETKQLTKEINYATNLEHPCITKFYDLLPFSHRTLTSAIISNFVATNSLQNLIQLRKENPTTERFNDTTKLISLYGIARGMAYLHSQGIIHCNLKPENVLVNKNGHPYVTDYALSYFNHNLNNLKNIELSEVVHGSILYFPPEFYDHFQYTKKGDVYAFSMIAYELLANKKPFEGQETPKIIQKVKSGIRPKLDPSIPIAYQNLIKKCWNKDPNKRPTFGQIIKELDQNRGFISETVVGSKYYLYAEEFNSFPLEKEEPFVFDKFDEDELLQEDVEEKKKKKGKKKAKKGAENDPKAKGKGANAKAKGKAGEKDSASKSKTKDGDSKSKTKAKDSDSKDKSKAKDADSKDKTKDADSKSKDEKETADSKDKGKDADSKSKSKNVKIKKAKSEGQKNDDKDNEDEDKNVKLKKAKSEDVKSRKSKKGENDDDDDKDNNNNNDDAADDGEEAKPKSDKNKEKNKKVKKSKSEEIKADKKDKGKKKKEKSKKRKESSSSSNQNIEEEEEDLSENKDEQNENEQQQQNDQKQPPAIEKVEEEEEVKETEEEFEAYVKTAEKESRHEHYFLQDMIDYENKTREEKEIDKLFDEDKELTIYLERKFRDTILKRDISCRRCKQTNDYENLYKESKLLYKESSYACYLSTAFVHYEMFYKYLKKSLELMELSVEQCCIDTVHDYTIFLNRNQKVNPTDYTKFEKFLKMAAFENFNDSIALYLDLYSQKKIVNKNYAELGKLYDKLSTIQTDPIQSNESYLNAAFYYKKASNKNHLDSMFRYAQMIEEGKLNDEDKENAIKLYRKAAQKGHAGSLYKCAKMIEDDKNSSRSDIERAVEMYKKSALMNYPDAMFRYAQILEDICMIKSDRQRAIELYQKATYMNHPPSMFRFAQILEDGVFVVQNRNKATELIKKSADMKYPNAMYRYAQMLEEGYCVVCDKEEAFNLYLMAMQLNHPESTFRYAQLYSERNVKPNQQNQYALYLFKRAADFNKLEYVTHYARLVRSGTLAPANLQEAEKYDKIALELSS